MKQGCGKNPYAQITDLGRENVLANFTPSRSATRKVYSELLRPARLYTQLLANPGRCDFKADHNNAPLAIVPISWRCEASRGHGITRSVWQRELKPIKTAAQNNAPARETAHCGSEIPRIPKYGAPSHSSARKDKFEAPIFIMETEAPERRKWLGEQANLLKVLPRKNFATT